MAEPPLIILTAAEASGDLHAAHLVRAMRRRLPEARLVAFGGPRLAEAGAELLADLTSRSAMLLGSIGRVPEMIAHYVRFSRFLDRHRAALHIPVDSPVINLPLARQARVRGVPVLYYVAPQLWAWGAWRMDKLRSRVNELACILPFEPDYFAGQSIKATFVGHPLLEPLAEFRPDGDFIAHDLPAGEPKIALLPGSRRHEIADHLPAQLRVAAELKRRHPRAAFVLAAPEIGHGHDLRLAEFLRDSPVPVTPAPGRLHDVLAWADLALVVSGSVTLEVAWFGVPMVVLYRVKRWQWRWIGRRVVKTPHLSLVNILAGRELVPELMPWFGDEGELLAAAETLLADPARSARLRSELPELVGPLARTPASERTADLAVGLIRAGSGE